jgi:hypothetical protein
LDFNPSSSGKTSRHISQTGRASSTNCRTWRRRPTPWHSLLATTVLPDIISRGADVQRRQSVFDCWIAALAVALRRDVSGLSVRRSAAGADCC